MQIKATNEWIGGSVQRWPQHQMDVCGQLHTPVALPPKTPVPNADEASWKPSLEATKMQIVPAPVRNRIPVA